MVEGGWDQWLGVGTWSPSTRLVTRCDELMALVQDMYDSEEWFNGGSQGSFNADCDEWLKAAVRIDVASKGLGWVAGGCCIMGGTGVRMYQDSANAE